MSRANALSTVARGATVLASAARGRGSRAATRPGARPRIADFILTNAEGRLSLDARHASLVEAMEHLLSLEVVAHDMGSERRSRWHRNRQTT